MASEQTQPLPAAIEAAVSLLADAEPRVVAACREQLLRWGEPAVPVLRRVAIGSDARLRVRARSLLRTLELRAWSAQVRSFARAIEQGRPARIGAGSLLESGLLLLSSLTRAEDLDRAGYEGAVAAFGRELRGKVRGRTAASAARSLGAYMAERLEFTAESASLYDLDAVAIDVATQRRLATPLVLALLYAIVGRRAGLRVTVVGLPEDWLVRVHGARPVLVDPLRGGESLTKADCVRHLRVTGYSSGASAYLSDLDDRALLLAHVESLQRVFGYREDGEVLRALRQAHDALGRVADSTK